MWKIPFSRALIAVLLAFIQSAPAWAQLPPIQPNAPLTAAAERIRSQVENLPVGGRLTVNMLDGNQYCGNLTYRESLRDIEACLRSVGPKLYHMGLRGKVSRTTLADANERHDWRIFADFAQVLIGVARPLYARDPIGVDLDQSLYALDSTTIDLCLALFP